VCDALLRAADRCLETQCLAEITVRQIAATADVNPAMINYYFNSKEGLFVALIEFLFLDWEQRVRALADQVVKSRQVPTAPFVALVDECIYQHAPVIRLLDAELAKSVSGVQAAYEERLAARVTNALSHLIRKAGEAGVYRADVDLRHVTFAVASVAIHPVAIAPAALHKAYRIGNDELRSQAWLEFLEHTIDRILRP